MATRKSGARSAPLAPKVADRLLDLLSTDDAFRRLFRKDPLAALVQAGHKPTMEELAASAAERLGPPFKPPGPPPAAPPVAGCARVERLASKTAIVKARDELRSMLTAGLSQQPIQLDAASKATLRSRK
jgi:putative modified peptide